MMQALRLRSETDEDGITLAPAHVDLLLGTRIVIQHDLPGFPSNQMTPFTEPSANHIMIAFRFGRSDELCRYREKRRVSNNEKGEYFVRKLEIEIQFRT